MIQLRETSDVKSLHRLVCLTLVLLLAGCDQINTGQRSSSNPPQHTGISRSGSDAQTGLGSHTLYRAREGAPQFQISNLQQKSNDRFELDWRRTSPTNRMGTGFYSLILRFPSQNSPVEINLHIWDHQDSGRISGHIMSFNFGQPKNQGHVLDRGCEIFIAKTQGFDIYKLSNSITVGGVSELAAQAPPKRTQTTAENSSKSTSPTQPVPTEKEPIAEAELSLLPANLKIREGMYLYAQLSGNWIPVKVLGTEAGDQTKVHWLGFSDSWDTSLQPDQLRIKTNDLDILTPKP